MRPGEYKSCLFYQEVFGVRLIKSMKICDSEIIDQSRSLNEASMQVGSGEFLVFAPILTIYLETFCENNGKTTIYMRGIV